MINEQPSILHRLAENEEAIGILYQEYAKRFPDYESFWVGLASEEKEHASWIRRLYSTAAESALFFNPKRFNKEAAVFSPILYLKSCFQFNWSGRRDSNPRQPAWKAGTLPTELLPHSYATGKFYAKMNGKTSKVG